MKASSFLWKCHLCRNLCWIYLAKLKHILVLNIIVLLFLAENHYGCSQEHICCIPNICCIYQYRIAPSQWEKCQIIHNDMICVLLVLQNPIFFFFHFYVLNTCKYILLPEFLLSFFFQSSHLLSWHFPAPRSRVREIWEMLRRR